MKRILLVGENEDIKDLKEVWKEKFICKIADSFEKSIEMCEREHFDVLIFQKEMQKVQISFREFILTTKIRFPSTQVIVLLERENPGELEFFYNWSCFDIFVKGMCLIKDIEKAIERPKTFLDVKKDFLEITATVKKVYDWLSKTFFYLTEIPGFVSTEETNGFCDYYFIINEKGVRYEVTLSFFYFNDRLGENFKARVCYKSDYYFTKNIELPEKDYPEKIKEITQTAKTKYRTGRRLRGIFEEKIKINIIY